MDAIFLDIDGVLATPLSDRLNALLRRTPFDQLFDPAALWQLRRLVRILLDNAVKYAGPPHPAVRVALTRQQDKLRLTVHNTGDPIPPEHLPHLFERFYRADAARDRAQGGYGLGLAIAKSITETHRGRISVTSTPDSGTTFTVLLPRR